MATITNTHKTRLSVRDVTLQPNTPTPVHNWEEISKNAVVAAWVKAGILKVEDASVGNQGSKFEQPNRDELVAKLAALGVKHHPNTGVPKLQAMLADAEAKASLESLYGSNKLPAYIDIAEGKSVQLGEVVALAHTASGLTVGAWNALPEEERDALLDAEVERMKAEAAQGTEG